MSKLIGFTNIIIGVVFAMLAAPVALMSCSSGYYCWRLQSRMRPAAPRNLADAISREIAGEECDVSSWKKILELPIILDRDRL